MSRFADWLWSRKPEDHDIRDLRAGKTSTPWKQFYACPHCLNEINHDEYMSDICLSCGGNVEYSLDWISAARRKIIYGGKWIVTSRINGEHYRLKAGRWIKIKTPADGAGA